MLIRGGANYAYEQVVSELSTFLCERYSLPASAFRLAVCGLRVLSEHEDECCVMVELLMEDAEEVIRVGDVLKSSFVTAAKGPGGVSKGAKPDRFALGSIPMVASKGIVSVPELTKLWKTLI
jgi:hypothetical protein